MRLGELRSISVLEHVVFESKNQAKALSSTAKIGTLRGDILYNWAGTMAELLQNVVASCAICGASAMHGECEHEGQRLERALDQAVARWAGMQAIR